MIHSRIIQKRCYYKTEIDPTIYSKVVYQRKAILDRYELLKQQDCDEPAIIEVLAVSRASIYRWRSRFRKYGLIGLEPDSRAPRIKRKPGWSRELELRIYQLRKEYPLWGKAKIAVMYKRKYSQKVPVSTVGRILNKLIKTKAIWPVKWLLFGKINIDHIPVISIQVDGGSEFMRDFETLCAKKGINLFVLPPYSPELNGNVERVNGTFRYEFYEQYNISGSLIELQNALQKFVVFYNKIRPHHGVGLLTPYEAYELINKNGGLQSHM